jgi:hypothetical protein
LFLGVSIPCLVGFGVIGPELVRFSGSVSSACKWAAITAAIVAQPLIGKASQVGFERLLGTLIGGGVGYVVHQIGLLVFGEALDGIFKSLAAGVFASLSILFGEQKFKLNTSAKLFVVTLLLVTFAGENGDIEGYAVARVCGILLGVCLMLLLSMVVFPKSATVEALHNMDDALESLSYLTLVIWKGWCSDDVDLMDGGIDEPLVLEEKHDRNMENALTKLYESLFDMEENLNAAASEVLVTKTSGNSLILIPRLSIGESQSPASHLPVAELNDMADAVRKVARALFTLEKALDDWKEVWTQTSDDESMRSLETIRRNLRDVSDEIQDCFPLKDSMNPQLLLTMIQNINKWESTGKKNQMNTSKAITIRNSLQHLEQQASFSLSIRQAYDGCYEVQHQEEEDDEPPSTEQEDDIVYSPEWGTLAFALQECASEFGALWHQCGIVLQRLPYHV